VNGSSAASLFQPDLFSRSSQEFTKTSKSAAAEISSVLSEYYGISASDIEEPLPKAVNSRLFRSGNIILKKVSTNTFKDAESAETHLRFIEKLRNLGVLLPEILPGRNKKLAQTFPSFFIYAMKAAEDECTYLDGDRETILSAFQTAAGFYKAAAAQGAPAALSSRDFNEGNDKDALLKVPIEIRNDKTVAHHWTAFEAAYKKDYASFEPKPLTLCHIDLHPHNILVKNRKIVLILDLESIRPCWKIASIGFSIFKLLRNYAVQLQDTSSLKKLREEIYTELVNTGVLNREDLLLLPLGARLENVKRFLTVVQNHENFLNWGDRLPIFGRALAGEIDAVMES
jgi:hypothetical protein